MRTSNPPAPNPWGRPSSFVVCLLNSRDLLAVGILGNNSNLRHRIETLLHTRTFFPRISTSGIATTLIASAVFLLAASIAPRWVVIETPAFAQSPPRFEVASIKPNTSGEDRVSGGFQPGERFRVTNYPLRALIAAAYMRPQVNPDFLIACGPEPAHRPDGRCARLEPAHRPDGRCARLEKWMDSDRFDIDAKSAADFPPGADGPTAPSRVMLQTLLAERFHLAVHHENRAGPVYALVFARGNRIPGPHLRTSTADCATSPVPPGVCFARIGPGSFTAGGTTLAQFNGLLPRFVDRVVVDATGLTGRFDMELSWTPAPGEWVAPQIPGGPAAAPSGGPSLFTAIQEQLGLKLEARTAPIDTLIVDRAEKPDAN